jgi:hypothetical protein
VPAQGGAGLSEPAAKDDAALVTDA